MSEHPNKTASPSKSSGTVLYKERQWVPFYWWIAAVGVVAILTYQLGHHRSLIWWIVGAVIFSAAALWVLFSLSKREISVVEEPDGQRWLHVGPASLPASVVSRTLVVPATAKSAAMGRQLDPEAYLVSRAWIPEMAMLVLDDPEDPTPYWLISSKNPQELLEALGRPIY